VSNELAQERGAPAEEGLQYYRVETLRSWHAGFQFLQSSTGDGRFVERCFSEFEQRYSVVPADRQPGIWPLRPLLHQQSSHDNDRRTDYVLIGKRRPTTGGCFS